jgi:uncharacterized membrane protein
MDTNAVNRKFDDIIQSKAVNQIVKEKRPPSKFPELRYLWGITFLVSFVMIVTVSVISTLLDAL